MRKNFIAWVFLFLPFQSFAVTWTEPLTISPKNSEVCKVSVNQVGHAAAVWVHFDGTNAFAQAATYFGNWSAPTNLSTGQIVNNVLVTISNTDQVIAVWRELLSPNFVIRFSIYSDGIWSSPQTISTIGFIAFQPQLAMNGSGNAILIWGESTNTNDVIKAAHFTNGDFSAPITISTSTNSANAPQIALNDSGDAVADWIEFDLSTKIHLVKGTSFTSGIWDQPETLSQVENEAYNPNVAINEDGNGLAYWTSSSSTGHDVRVSHFDGLFWSASQRISTDDSNSSGVCISMDSTGNAIATWLQSTLSEQQYVSSTYDSSTSLWNTPSLISSTDQIVLRTSIEVEAYTSNLTQTNAIATWVAKNGSNTEVRTAEMTGLNNWSAPYTINPGNDTLSPSMSVNSSGEAVIIWNGFDNLDYVVQAVIGIP